MQENFWIVLDLAALCILVAAVTSCARKGFVRTVLGLMVAVVASYLAWQISLPLAQLAVEWGLPSLLGMADIPPALEGIAGAMLATPAVIVSRTIISSLLFFVLLAVGHHVIGIFRIVDAIPLVGPINSALGGVLGVAWAAIILCGLSLAMLFYLAASGGGNEHINIHSLSAGYLFGFFFRLVA